MTQNRGIMKDVISSTHTYTNDTLLINKEFVSVIYIYISIYI